MFDWENAFQNSQCKFHGTIGGIYEVETVLETIFTAKFPKINLFFISCSLLNSQQEKNISAQR